MKEMVNAFSEYARAPRFEMASVDLNKVVHRGGRPVPCAGRRGARMRLRRELDPALDSVIADQGRVRQLLHNLLTNAVEALEGHARRRDPDRDAPRARAAATRWPRSRSRTTGPASSAS